MENMEETSIQTKFYAMVVASTGFSKSLAAATAAAPTAVADTAAAAVVMEVVVAATAAAALDTGIFHIFHIISHFNKKKNKKKKNEKKFVLKTSFWVKVYSQQLIIILSMRKIDGRHPASL
jgi:opacity protein-like surface antigen